MEILSWYDTVNPEWWLKKIGESDWTAGQFLYELLRDNRFHALAGESAQVLLLTDGSRLASFCTYAERDDIPDSDLTPWMGFAYTFPEFRGRRLMEKLIRRVKELARADGKDHVYISTDHAGLYEKYGAVFREAAKDVRGGDSRIYSLNAYGFYGWEGAEVPARIPDYPGISTPKDLYNALWYVWIPVRRGCGRTGARRTVPWDSVRSQPSWYRIFSAEKYTAFRFRTGDSTVTMLSATACLT